MNVEKNQILFFRGTEQVDGPQDIRDGSPYIQKRHTQRFGVYDPSAETATAICNWMEVFKRFPEFKCPCCQCMVYNSVNWLERPEWLVKQEAEDAREMEYRALYA